MRNDYYVYEHRRATDGSLFYIGKGSGRRNNKVAGRNRYWKNVVAKHDYTVNILQENMTELAALELERKLIAENAHLGLVNMTLGGEGHTPTEEMKRLRGEKIRQRWTDPEYKKIMVAKLKAALSTEEAFETKRAVMLLRYSSDDERKKQSERMKKALSTDEARKLKSMSLHKRYESNEARIQTGQSTSKTWEIPEVREARLKGMALAKERNAGKVRRCRCPEVYFFSSESEAFIGTQRDFIKYTGIGSDSVSLLARGKAAMRKGWTLLGRAA